MKRYAKLLCLRISGRPTSSHSRVQLAPPESRQNIKPPYSRPGTTTMPHTSSPPRTAHYGIGGWLFWLILGLIALAPALDMAKLQASIQLAEAYLPVLGNAPAWGGFKWAAWTCFAVSAGIGIYAGDRLIFDRSWRAVRLAIGAVWVKFVIGVLTLDYVLPRYCVLDTWPSLASAGILLPLLLYGGVTGYLLRSQRVRITYPRKEGRAITSMSART